MQGVETVTNVYAEASAGTEHGNVQPKKGAGLMLITILVILAIIALLIYIFRSRL